MRKTFASLVAAGLIAATGSSLAADFSDTWIGYRRSNDYHDPGISAAVPKNIYTLGHFSGYKYGTNFFAVDLLQSLENDPSNKTSNAQAQELYAVYRSALSASKVMGTKYEFGPIRDFLLTFGFDAGAKNTAFAPKPFKLLIGPTINVGLPIGFIDFSLFAYNETNNNGIVNKKVDFDTTWQANALWGTFFHLGLPARFTGFLSVTGPKGKDGFGVETVTETLLRASLQWDIGTLASLNKGTVYAGIGYEYWKNKFGNPSSVPGTKTSAPTINLQWHF